MRGGTDIVGYIASGLVLLTFTTKEMRSLRIMAILSNLAFIAYGLLDEILPVLALHVILFPLNVFRLAQLAREGSVPQELRPSPAQSGRSTRSLGQEIECEVGCDRGTLIASREPPGLTRRNPVHLKPANVGGQGVAIGAVRIARKETGSDRRRRRSG